MAERSYNRDHAWVKVEGNQAAVGISDFAQSELGEVSYVELPAVGRRVSQGEAVCAIDSLKSASEIYAPLSGRIVEVNERLAEECSAVNSDPLGEGWLFKLEIDRPEELAGLMSAEEYKRYVGRG